MIGPQAGLTGDHAMRDRKLRPLRDRLKNTLKPMKWNIFH